VTLQGGIEALQLLAQVYRAREEPQKATQVEARIRALEQQDGPEAPAPPA